METAYYSYYACENIKASGGEDRHAVLVRTCAPRRRPAGGNNVISLEDYRAAQALRVPAVQPEEDAAAEYEDAPWAQSEEETPEVSGGVCRRRNSARRSARYEKLLMGLDVAACAALIAVAAAVCAVFL